MLKIDRTSFAFKIISFSIIIVLAAIIAKIFIDNWSKLSFDTFRFNYTLLISTFLFSIINSLYPAWLWGKILNALNEKPRLLDIWRINMYCQMARYIPGKIWQYMGKIYWGQKINLSKTNILVSTLLESILSMFGAAIISLFSIKMFLTEKSVIIIFVLFFLVLCALHPKILGKAITIVGKKWLQAPYTLNLRYSQIILFVFLYSLLWISIGFQLFLFVHSFYKLSFDTFISFISINAASWLIGFASIIAPSGLVVKEGVFIFGFKTIVPVSIAIVCAISIRLFHIVTEICITVVFFIFDKGAWKNLIEFRKTSKTVKADTNEPKEQK